MTEHEKTAREIAVGTGAASTLIIAIAAALDEEAVKAERERCINLIATAIAKTRGEEK